MSPGCINEPSETSGWSQPSETASMTCRVSGRDLTALRFCSLLCVNGQCELKELVNRPDQGMHDLQEDHDSGEATQMIKSNSFQFSIENLI